MGERASLREFLAGVEGLALLRLAFADAEQARAVRLAELRELFTALDRDRSLDTSAAGDEHDLDEGYRVWSQSYDRPLRLFPIEAPPVHRRVDALPIGVALDAACGTGRHSEYLAESGHDVIGVDRSEEMLQHARAKISGARFVHGDLTALPVEPESVDAALCALALVHVADLDVVFAEFARVVRVGGRLIISDVHPMLVALGWQAQFGFGRDGRGFIRLRHHLVSDYITAGVRNGFALCNCDEPPLTRDAARTPAGGRAPEACEQAFAGLPAVLVLEFERV
jgi:SAM-dependent methyltransferase